MSRHIGSKRQENHRDPPLPRTMFTAFYATLPDRAVSLFMTDAVNISNGTFGVVYRANVYEYPQKSADQGPPPTPGPQIPKVLAVKRVFQDPRFKNRELEITRMLIHPNIIALKFYFKTTYKNESFLWLIMEYVSTTLASHIGQVFGRGGRFSESQLKNYSRHLFSAMQYIHSLGICHRDIKPQNILVDPPNCMLKLCDFGSAKKLVATESNVAYICSRHYRAPELIMGCTLYDTAIDVWASGCVLAEFILGRRLFMGQTSIDQLAEIVAVIGLPEPPVLKAIQPNFVYVGRRSAPKTLSSVLDTPHTAFRDIIEKMLVFVPSERSASAQLLEDAFFS